MLIINYVYIFIDLKNTLLYIISIVESKKVVLHLMTSFINTYSYVVYKMKYNSLLCQVKSTLFITYCIELKSKNIFRKKPKKIKLLN